MSISALNSAVTAGVTRSGPGTSTAAAAVASTPADDNSAVTLSLSAAAQAVLDTSAN